MRKRTYRWPSLQSAWRECPSELNLDGLPIDKLGLPELTLLRAADFGYRTVGDLRAASEQKLIDQFTKTQRYDIVFALQVLDNEFG